jgi:galactoside O-acetyltransferase
VTLAERVTVLTHTNVGYRDHPLQKYFPAFTRPVRFGQACFIGVNATIMPGVVVGAGAFVAAGAVVTHSIPPGMVVAGVPARVIRKVTDAVDNQQT